jgi:hypothetical protein
VSSDSFVGRHDVVPSLIKVLEGGRKGAGQLTIQGIAGPGGIGKSMLLDHALEKAALEGRGYLTLSFTGDAAQGGLIQQLRRAIESTPTTALKSKPVGFYFAAVNRVMAIMEGLKRDAMAEASKSDDKLDPNIVGEWIDAALSAGQALNDVSKVSADWVNFKELNKHALALKKALPALVTLRNESPGILARLGLDGGSTLRNLIRENPAKALADALMADLSAIISGYRRADWAKPSHPRLPGVERLLLVVDDYEFVHESMGPFLAGELLPMLRVAEFETVLIVLGRDALASTQVEFDSKDFEKHQLSQIFVDRLSREDLDRLLVNNGFHDADNQARAWRDTEGYPYYVQLWMEETRSGSGSAEMARRFHRRTTRWMSQKQAGWLDVTLFMGDVNKESLRRMLDDSSEADAAFSWFEKEGSVRDSSSSTFRVREYLRTRLLTYLRNSDPTRYRVLEQRAATSAREEVTAG